MLLKRVVNVFLKQTSFINPTIVQYPYLPEYRKTIITIMLLFLLLLIHHKYTYMFYILFKQWFWKLKFVFTSISGHFTGLVYKQYSACLPILFTVKLTKRHNTCRVYHFSTYIFLKVTRLYYEERVECKVKHLIKRFMLGKKSV